MVCLPSKAEKIQAGFVRDQFGMVESSTMAMQSLADDVVQNGPNLLVLRFTFDECYSPCEIISLWVSAVMHRLEEEAVDVPVATCEGER